MKHSFRGMLFAILILAGFNSHGQSIPINTLFKLSGQKVDSIEEFISINGWKYEKVEEVPGSYSRLSYSYHKSEYFANRAAAFFAIKYSENYDGKRINSGGIEYQYSDSAYHVKFIKALKAMGMKLDKIEHTEDFVIKTYKNDTYEVVLWESSAEYAKTRTAYSYEISTFLVLLN